LTISLGASLLNPYLSYSGYYSGMPGPSSEYFLLIDAFYFRVEVREGWGEAFEEGFD
jgi:hypothetical protein